VRYLRDIGRFSRPAAARADAAYLPNSLRISAWVALVFSSVLWGPIAANAADPPLAYPHRVVTLVTHSSPGGGSDVFLREMLRHLPKHIDATFIVENVSGGSSARAVARVATAKPDGSVFYATTPTYIYTSLLSQPQYSYKDLLPVVNFFTDSEVIYSRVDGPFGSLEDVLEHARAQRGRWGAANPASLERQAAEQLKRATGVNAAVVSHEGGGDLMINVLNGTLEIGVGEIGETRAQLEAGQIRILATFNPVRMPAFPDVPTVRELGYEVVMEKFRGLAAPQGLPPEIIQIWNDVTQRLLADPEYIAAYSRENLVSQFVGHDEYPAFIAEFAARTEFYLREVGVIR
jgi:putative tricarboxylic transport membrane protein